MVSTSTVIVSLILFLLSLWLTIWLLRAMLSPFFSFLRLNPSRGSSRGGIRSFSLFPKKGFAERWAFRRCMRAMKDIETSLNRDKKVRNTKLFLTALYLEPIREDFELIGKSAHHHLDLLNKLIILAEHEGGSVHNLPKLEQLFSKRTELLKGSFEAALAKRRFSEKQRSKGKKPPNWSTQEFDTKLKDLEKEMKELRKEIMDEMKSALESLGKKSSAGPEDKHYH